MLSIHPVGMQGAHAYKLELGVTLLLYSEFFFTKSNIVLTFIWLKDGLSFVDKIVHVILAS